MAVRTDRTGRGFKSRQEFNNSNLMLRKAVSVVYALQNKKLSSVSGRDYEKTVDGVGRSGCHG